MFVFSFTVSIAMLAVGILSVTWEFLRPGLVIPGVAGSLLLIFGAHSLWVTPVDWSRHWLWLVTLAMPVAGLQLFLLAAARRARKNKRVTIL